MKGDNLKWNHSIGEIRHSWEHLMFWNREHKIFHHQNWNWSKPTEICRQFVNIAFDGEILVLKSWTCRRGTSSWAWRTWGGRGGPKRVKGWPEGSLGDLGGQGGTLGGRGGPEGVEESPEDVVRDLRGSRGDLRGSRGDLRAHVLFLRWYEMILHDCAMITQWILKR